MRVLAAAAIVLLVALNALPAASAEAPRLQADPFRVELVPGASFSGFLTLTNPNDEPQEYALSVQSPVTVVLDATSTRVDARATQKIGFLVTVPGDFLLLRAGQEAPVHEALLRFEAADPVFSSHAFLTLNVTNYNAPAPRHYVGVLPATGESGIGATIEDGNTVDAQVHVRNQNTTTGTYAIRVRELDGWTSTVTPSSLTLAPDERAVVYVRFTPSPSARNGTTSIDIGGTALAHTSVAVSLNITHVNATRDLARLSVTADVASVLVPLRSNASFGVTVRNEGTSPWNGPVSVETTGGFLVEGPSIVAIEPGDKRTLTFQATVRPDATDTPGAATIRVGDESVTVALDAAPPIRIVLDQRALTFDPTARQKGVNVTVHNDGNDAWSGELELAGVPSWLLVSGDPSLAIPPNRSVTRELGFTALGGPPDADVEIVLRAGGAESPLRIVVDSPRAQGLAILFEGPIPLFEVGETAVVNVRVMNLNETAWSGVLTIEAIGAVATQTSAVHLSIEGSGEALVPVYAITNSTEPGRLVFRADAAVATLPVNARPKPTGIAGEIGIAAVALPVAAVAVGATTLAIAPKRWPLAFAGLYARLARSRLLEHPTRARIRALIEAEPGLTHNEIGRRLDLERGTLDHHLAKLVKSGLVVAVPDGQLRRHYAPGSAQPATRAALDTRILTHVRERGTPTPASEVAQALGVSRQAMHYHLRRMVREGSVVAQRSAGGLLLRLP